MRYQRSKHRQPSSFTAHVRHAVVAALIGGLLFTTVANAAAYLNGPATIRVEYGRAKTVGPDGKLIIERRGSKPRAFIVNLDAIVLKDGLPAVLTGISVGDGLTVKYVRGLDGRIRVVEVGATSLTISGRVAGVDRSGLRVTIRDLTARTVRIEPQTVILWNGSLATIDDILPGMSARAEFDGVDHSKLMRLKLDN